MIGLGDERDSEANYILLEAMWTAMGVTTGQNRNYYIEGPGSTTIQ